MQILIVILFGAAFGALGWYFASGIKIKSGWQNTRSPLARWLDARRRARFEEQLPEALATMGNALKAGFSLSQAFDSVIETHDAPLSEEFSILQRQIRVGMPFDDALASMSKRLGSEDFELVAAAISASRKTGGNVTEIFDRIAETIRERARIARLVKSKTSQGRLQGIIVSAMPIVLAAAMTAMKPKMMLPFLASPLGLGCIAAMCVLILAGWLMIRKIVNIEV